jgi:hypothetical protein
VTRKLALAVEIVAAYARARWCLWRTDLPSAVATLRGDADGIPDQAAFRLGRAVGRTLRFLPFDSRCLMRSLVLVVLLARRGIRSSLVIGVAPGPTFDAHAWVESGGVALLPSGEPAYGRVAEL